MDLRPAILFLRSIHVVENLLRRLEKLYYILNDDRNGRQGERQGQVENGFADPKIKRRESDSDPNRITPLTGDQFVETQFAAKPVLLAPLLCALAKALKHHPGTIFIGQE